MKTITLIFIISIKTVFAFAQAGNLDSTFSEDGIATAFTDGYVYSVVIQNDEKIIAGGTTSGGAFAIARFKTDGVPDSTFDGDGNAKVSFGSGYEGSLALQTDGKILIAGTCLTNNGGYDFCLARLNIDGTLDNTFSGNGKTTASISPINYYDFCFGITVQSDGKILLCGTSYINDTTAGFSIFRFNSNGTLDNSFGNGGNVLFPIGNSWPEANGIIELPNGKILVGGSSGTPSGAWAPSCFALAQLNSNGTLDNSFGKGGKVTTYFGAGDATDDDGARAMVVQPDGKIILAGTSGLSSNPYTTIALARYNSSGSLDHTFGIFGKMTCPIPNYPFLLIFGCALQQDGKIIVVGSCDNFDTSSYNLVARFNINGVLDTTFGDGGFVKTKLDWDDNLFLGVAIQQDGKIVAVGESYGFAVVRYLSGLNVGILDLSVSDNSILIYPNPIQSQATLQYTLTQEEKISIVLYDMQGKLVQQFFTNETRTTGKHEEMLHLNELLPAGNYILSIGNGKNSQRVKIVKE